MSSVEQVVLIVLGLLLLIIAMTAIAYRLEVRANQKKIEKATEGIVEDIFKYWDLPDWSPNTMPTEDDLE